MSTTWKREIEKLIERLGVDPGMIGYGISQDQAVGLCIALQLKRLADAASTTPNQDPTNGQ